MTLKKSFTNADELLKEAFGYCCNNNFIKAKKIYDELILILPNETQVLTNLGTIEIQLGNNQKGLELLKKSISINPLQSNVLCNIANLLTDLDNTEEALIYYQKALEIERNQAYIYYNQARALKKLNYIIDSIDSYTKAIQLNNTYFLAYFNRGIIFYELKNFDAAIQDFDRVIKLQDNFYPAFYQRARLFQDFKNFKAAIRDYTSVINIRSDYPEAYNNRGMVFHELQNFDEALRNYNEALNLKKDYADAISNRAALYRDLGDLNNAISEYQNVLKIDNKHKDALYNLGLTYLKNKEFQMGWSLYEKRLELQEFSLTYEIRESNKLPKNVSLKNKHILILSEQGIGDEIFFSRMLNSLKKTKAKLSCLVDSRLVKLFKRSFNGIDFISKEVSIETFKYDYAISCSSLGHYLNYQPINEKPYLSSSIEKKISLKELMKSKDYKYICGISWKSLNLKIGKAKSLDLEKLLPLLSLPNTIYINLQYGDVDNEINFIKNKYNIEILKFEEINYYEDIDTLASLINACDFVVSTSNITAHLSGGLGKCTFLLLPYANAKIWYWHDGVDKSLWYTSVQMFSQTHSNNWDSVINNVLNELKNTYYA